jgi:hypothetical protein
VIFSRKPKKPALSREEALAAKPIRAVEADLDIDEQTGAGKLKVKIEAKRKWVLFRLPAGATKTFELDEVGVYVWKKLDGSTSVESLMRQLAKQYNLDLKQAEASTVAFLQMLIKRGLVGLKTEK